MITRARRVGERVGVLEKGQEGCRIQKIRVPDHINKYEV